MKILSQKEWFEFVYRKGQIIYLLPDTNFRRKISQQTEVQNIQQSFCVTSARLENRNWLEV